MAILFLRNVPRDVVKRLKALAAHEERSVSKTAVRHLDKSTQRIYNAVLLKDSPKLNVSAEEVLAAIDEARAERDAQIDARIEEWFADR